MTDSPRDDAADLDPGPPVDETVPPPDPGRWGRRAILVLSTALALPFVPGGYALSEGAEVALADRLRESPLDPAPWAPRAATADPGSPEVAAPHAEPPVGPLLIAAARGAGPRAPWAMRVALLPLVWLLAASFHALAGRFVTRPTVATALVLAAPAVWITLGRGLLPALPALAFSAAALAAQASAADRGDRWGAARAGTWLGLAVLSHPLAWIAAPVVVALPVLAPAGGSHLALAAAAAAPAAGAFGIFQALTWFGTGTPHVAASLSAAVDGLRSLTPERTVAAAAFVGGAVLLPTTLVPALGWVRARTRWSAVLLRVTLLLAATTAAGLSIPLPGYPPAARAAVVFLAASGVAALVVPPRRGTRSPQDRLLFAWAAWAVAAPTLLARDLSATALAPSAVPLVLLAVRGAEARAGASRATGRQLAASLFASLGIGAAVAAADITLRGAHHALATEAAARYQRWPEGVWYSAGWGLGPALAASGFSEVPSAAAGPTFLRPGDLVLVPDQAPSRPAADLGVKLSLREAIPVNSPLPVRLAHRGAHAGFLSWRWGLLPFGISAAPVEVLRAYEVE